MHTRRDAHQRVRKLYGQYLPGNKGASVFWLVWKKGFAREFGLREYAHTRFASESFGGGSFGGEREDRIGRWRGRGREERTGRDRNREREGKRKETKNREEPTLRRI